MGALTLILYSPLRLNNREPAVKAVKMNCGRKYTGAAQISGRIEYIRARGISPKNGFLRVNIDSIGRARYINIKRIDILLL